MPTTRSSTSASKFSPIATDNVFLGDCSYSMKSTNGGSQEGAVEYMRNQKENAMKLKSVNGDVLQYIAFDNKTRSIYLGDASNITDAHYDEVYNTMEPRGGTALYDAIHKYLLQQMKRLDDLKRSLNGEVRALVYENPSLLGVSFAVMTDGLDNSSTKTEKDCKELIEKYKNEYGGVVLFIASNLDAVTYASRMGIRKEHSLQMGNDRSSSIGAAKAVSFAQHRSTSSQGMGEDIPMFTQYERSISNSQQMDPVECGTNKVSLCRTSGNVSFSLTGIVPPKMKRSSSFKFPGIEEDSGEESERS